jgi:hypothetical protein
MQKIKLLAKIAYLAVGLTLGLGGSSVVEVSYAQNCSAACNCTGIPCTNYSCITQAGNCNGCYAPGGTSDFVCANSC